MTPWAERNAMAAPGLARHNQRVGTNAFWDDLAKDLADPDFRRAYVAETVVIASADAALNADESAAGQQGAGDDRCSS